MIVDVNRREDDEDGMQKHAETLMTETGLQAESLEISGGWRDAGALANTEIVIMLDTRQTYQSILVYTCYISMFFRTYLPGRHHSHRSRREAQVP